MPICAASIRQSGSNFATSKSRIFDSTEIAIDGVISIGSYLHFSEVVRLAHPPQALINQGVPMQRAIVANVLALIAIVAIAFSAAVPYTAGQIARPAVSGGR
jgi:hypothetical protein